MERVRTNGCAEAIAAAEALLPPLVRDRIGRVHHFEGDVEFAGIHSPRWNVRRRERYPWASWWGGRHLLHRAASERCQTVCYWPGATPPRVTTVLHELGHAFQCGLGSLWGAVGTVKVGMPDMRPVTNYQRDNYGEQFAEVFVDWLVPHGLIAEDERRRYRPEALYDANEVIDNRGMLAFLNERAGLPADTPPRALR